ncbi:MAG: hypothetical protein Q8R36_03090 [bacterium]|nr:hypothetical protein [bacterium]
MLIRDLLIQKTLLPIGMAVAYIIVLLITDNPVITTIITLFIYTALTFSAMCGAAAFPGYGAAFLAIIAATSASFAAFMATMAVNMSNIPIDIEKQYFDVLVVFGILAVMAIVIATIGAIATKNKSAKSPTTIVVAHDILWTVAIGAAVYFGTTLWGAVAVAVAILLPLILLKYETSWGSQSVEEEEHPVGI